MGALKIVQKCEGKYEVYPALNDLTVQSRGAPEGTLEGAPNDALSNPRKDA